MAAADVNQVLYDLSVGHQIGLQRLSTATVNRILALVARVEADVLVKLGYDNTEVSQARLNKLLDAVRAVMARGYALVTDELESDVGKLAAYEAAYQESKIVGALPISVEFSAPSVSQLQAAVLARPFQGRLLAEWGQDLEDGAFARVRDAIRIGYAEGETTPKIVSRLRGTRARGYADGVLSTSKRGAEGLVRTALNHTANYAREQVYVQNPDLIKGIRWVSTLDMRTTPICRARDGKIYPPGEGPRPPAHWNCRSTTAPVTKSWREMGVNVDDVPNSTRASMSGQVPATETYQTWLGRQSATAQDDVLGPTRGALFRRGGLTLDRFVDQRGGELTIAQLRARDASAFAAAGIR